MSENKVLKWQRKVSEREQLLSEWLKLAGRRKLDHLDSEFRDLSMRSLVVLPPTTYFNSGGTASIGDFPPPQG
jgi:hypothetical protein